MDAQASLFTVFSIVIIGFLAADLGYFNKKSHRIEFKPALYQSIFWVGISLIFGYLIFLFMNKDLAAEFISAYVTEKMLSVDNLFVMMLLFNYFKLDEKYHHRVLFWGILGAILLRGTFILAGAYMIYRFHWILYIFGIILICTGAKLLGDNQEEHIDFENNRLMKAAVKFLPVTQTSHQGRFFLKENGRFRLTSLFIIMLLVEETDLIFAVDSIPAVFSISQNVFIVFTSNIFAIMGLRSLFFLIENVLRRFQHLQKGLAFVLLFIGLKMLATIWNIHISSTASFVFIMITLAISILLSVLFPPKEEKNTALNEKVS